MTKIPARVPVDLYNQALPLVKGVGKPSWGQLIAWTCQDYRDEVTSEVANLDGQPSMARQPRGQNRVATGGPQVTARMNEEEGAVFADVVKAANTQSKKVGSEVTKTQVLIAALTVAARRAEVA